MVVPGGVRSKKPREQRLPPWRMVSEEKKCLHREGAEVRDENSEQAAMSQVLELRWVPGPFLPMQTVW